MKVSIRPLEEKDAATSYRWRNDPEIWRFTARKPDGKITAEMELEWIKEVLARPNEMRFAICVGDEGEYVGNVQLTNITSEDAQFHIFIGEKQYHGKGIGTEATRLILEYAFGVLMLKQVWLKVTEENTAGLKAYLKCGFQIVARTDSGLLMNTMNNL
jgi:RimJ/RimL family protein N-acetyltransferase